MMGGWEMGGRGLYIWDGGRCLVFLEVLFGRLVDHGRYLSVRVEWNGVLGCVLLL